MTHSGSVSVVLGDGAGNFSAPTTFSTGSGFNTVAVGDFNGDGKQDLANANGASSVSILLGDGAGNFSAPTNFNAGSLRYSVVVGDFNGDGKQDLALGGAGPYVSILLGDGAGNFNDFRSFPAGFDGLYLAVGDFNNDGKQDLAGQRQLHPEQISPCWAMARAISAPAASSASASVPHFTVCNFNSDGNQTSSTNGDSANVSICTLAWAVFRAAPNFGAGADPFSRSRGI